MARRAATERGDAGGRLGKAICRARGGHLRADRVDGEGYLFELVERLPVGIVLSDAGKTVFANARARALFGEDPDGRLQDPSSILGIEAVAEVTEAARRTGTESEVELAHRGRWLRLRAAPTTRDQVALVVADLTEARRVDEVRRDFVANASHELKTPVAGLQALSESLVLAMERDPDRARRMIGRMQAEASRLAAITRDLLDLARLEDAGSERRRAEVDVADVVATQWDRVAPLAGELGVELRRHPQEPTIAVAVPEDVRLVVGNLLENAVRYNRPDGWVDVVTTSRAGLVVLEVADSGIGIPDDEQDRVFERFYRVDKGRSRAHGGTGLGLSLVRHAVEREGGRVTLTSVLGQGSIFTVTFPTGKEA